MAKSVNGLGDVVELAAEVTGLKKVAKAVSKATGIDCGCGRRRDKLNKLMPFRGEDHASATEHDEHDSADGGGDAGSG